MPKGNWGSCVSAYVGKVIPQIFPSVLQKYIFGNCPRLPLYVSLKQKKIFPILFSIQGNVYSCLWLLRKTTYMVDEYSVEKTWTVCLCICSQFSFQGTVTLLGGKFYLERHLVIDHWELCEQCYFFLSCSVYTHCWINMLGV